METNFKKIVKELEKKREENPVINSKAKKNAIAAFNVITNKKKSPDIDLITKLKNLYAKEGVEDKPLKDRLRDNLLIKLSIEDYENICKDEEIFNTIIKILNIDEQKKLKKICKKIHIFTEHIDLSPSKIKDKMKAKTTPIRNLAPELLNGISTSNARNASTMKLFDLPEDVLEYITKDKLKYLFIKLDKYKLIDGIPEGKLNIEFLSENLNAIDYLIEKKLPIDYFYLSRNRNVIAMELLFEYLKENPNAFIAWEDLATNPEAIKILLANPDKIDMYMWKIQKNTNPAIIDYLNSINSINYNSLSDKTSSNAINLLKEQISRFPNIINWESLSANTEAIALLKANFDKIDWGGLSRNSNPEAIKLLEEEYKKNPISNRIDFDELSKNINPEAIKILSENPGKINWNRLLYNPNPKGIEYIDELLKINPNDENINWSILSENPAAIKLLKQKIKIENNLSEDEYDSINYRYKINWASLSKNKNPDAIKLIKKRIIYEKNLSENRKRKLDFTSKIDWDALSLNPSIFTIQK